MSDKFDLLSSMRENTLGILAPEEKSKDTSRVATSDDIRKMTEALAEANPEVGLGGAVVMGAPVLP